MSNFRDQVERDIKNTFLNEDEFADFHTIKTEDMNEPIDFIAVVQNETIGNSGLANSLHDIQPGLYGQRVFVSYMMLDVPETPVFGQAVVFDDKDYIVSAVAVDAEMVTLELVANER